MVVENLSNQFWFYGRLGKKKKKMKITTCSNFLFCMVNQYLILFWELKYQKLNSIYIKDFYIQNSVITHEAYFLGYDSFIKIKLKTDISFKKIQYFNVSLRCKELQCLKYKDTKIICFYINNWC